MVGRLKGTARLERVRRGLNLAKYVPKMRDAIENKWEPFLQNLTRAA
jgi:hypothetical protein